MSKYFNLLAIFFIAIWGKAFSGSNDSLSKLNNSSYSIVFVHLGDKLPDYLETAVTQARLFNKDCPIVVIASQKALSGVDFQNSDATLITCESLKISQEHNLFLKFTRLNKNFRDGFWLYTSERFLYLNDLMQQYQLQNVFHLENDNMLYANLEEILPVFESQYNAIGATFDNDERCIAGFVFIKNCQAMADLAKHFADYSKTKILDMQLINQFRLRYGAKKIDFLPVIMKEYTDENRMVSKMGGRPKDVAKFYKNIDLFDSIFDACAIGQYLGGEDPNNGKKGPGFVNERCLFDVSKLTFEWQEDELGRKVPYAIYKNAKYRVNNLHVHCKDLEKFKS